MVGRVISGAFDAYGALFGVLVPVAATIVVPFEGALLALQLAAADTERARDGTTLISALGSLLLVIPLVTVVATRAGQARERKAQPQPWRSLVEAFELLPAIAGTQLMVVLAISALPVLVILLGAAVGSGAVMTAGLLALFGSAVLNGVRLCLAVPVVLLEGIRFGGALRRSIELVRGAWGLVFLALVALVGCALMLQFGATLAVLALIGDEGKERIVAQRGAAALSTVLVAPFLALGSLQIYRARGAPAPQAAA